jgi:3'-phosphoadenosine 5'-phosphosulfate sulfotransferase (PAPS reductase)/FAD synthetase
MQTHNVINVSGGKDATALLLLAREAGAQNAVGVFADTGNEHPQTLEYIDYLHWSVLPIRRVQADFSAELVRRREAVCSHWPRELQQASPGGWRCRRGQFDDGTPRTGQIYPTWVPEERSVHHVYGDYEWLPDAPALSAEQAEQVIDRVVAVLQPTGNPYLDLCLLKGRFPSVNARFCTQRLKLEPIFEQLIDPLLEQGCRVVNWQGMRKTRGATERPIAAREHGGARLIHYRPLLNWTDAAVFALHKRHGIKPNPLYRQGMVAVGCMPCVRRADKDELHEISRRWPEVVDRVAEWERLVSLASRGGRASFFTATRLPGGGGPRAPLPTIRSMVAWSKTSRGGRTVDWIRLTEEAAPCASAYGLCD